MNFSPSSRRIYIEWLNYAKRTETRLRRIDKIVILSEKNIQTRIKMMSYDQISLRDDICTKKRMKKFIRKHIVAIIFSIAGSIAGLLYWRFVGCVSGTCIIKSVWYLSTLYGLALGWVMGSLAEDLIVKFKKTK